MSPSGKRVPGITAPNYGTFGTDKRFTKFNHELYRSAAYHSLTPIQRLVLRDMIGEYMIHSEYDSVHKKTTESFIFSFLDCKERIKQTAFYHSIRCIIRNGFFRTDPENPAINGASQRFFSSDFWRDFQPSQTELVDLNEYAARRTKNLPNPLEFIGKQIDHLNRFNDPKSTKEILKP